MTQLVRLLGSVLVEGLVSVGHMLRFFLQRRSTRARIRSLLFESRSAYPSDGIVRAPGRGVGAPDEPVLEGAKDRVTPASPAQDDGARKHLGTQADKIPVGVGVGMLGGGLALLGIVGILTAGLLLGGCASSPLEQQRKHGAPVPGTSFERQWQELGDSVAVLADMSDAQRSLESDLSDFGSGTSFSDAADDLETLLLDPGSQRSMEDDLREFGKSDPQSFWETLLMLGW